MKKKRVIYILLCLCVAVYIISCTSDDKGDETPFADRVWGTAELIETNNSGGARIPQLGVDRSGNAIALWIQYDGVLENVWSNCYVPGTEWGTAELIEIDDSGDADKPQIGVDGNGNAVAVWQLNSGTRENIWSSRYTQGSGWILPVLIETDDIGDALHPQVGVDGSGNAIALWQQWDGARYNIWSNRYVSGIGWGTAELIETDNNGSAYDPQIAVDANGNGVAVWHQSDGTRPNIWSNRYVSGTGWGTAQLIETDNNGAAVSAQVDVAGSGDTIAVWYQYDGTRFNVWSNRYVAGTGWVFPQLIETDNSGDALNPQVAVAANGDAIAVWYQLDGTRFSIWSNRYVSGTGWGTAELIETDNSGDAWFPQIGIDADGNGIAVWYQSDGTRDNIWSNRYVAGTGWGTAELIETDNSSVALDPQVAVSANGDAVAVWKQADGVRNNIWSNTRR